MEYSAKIDPSWMKVIGQEFDQPYMKKLKHFLKSELAQGKTIYPHGGEIFQAFNATPFEQVKVVIIGQDPYHGPGQAHGLCFSVRPNTPLPPSLKNIYSELKTDLGEVPPTHGHLMGWAQQGVLLLNQVLTVEKGKAGSHHGQGWELFTDAVVRALSEKKKDLVFLLWGSPAQKKAKGVDPKRHHIIKSPHPSPLSAYRGFFGSRPFSRANQFLVSRGRGPLRWGDLPREAPAIAPQ